MLRAYIILAAALGQHFPVRYKMHPKLLRKEMLPAGIDIVAAGK
jgi:hypothetical protein